MKLGQTSAIHFLSRVVTTIAGFIANIYIARVVGAEVLGTYFLIVSVLAWVAIPSNMGLAGALKKRISESDLTGEYMAAGIVLQMILYGIAVLSLWVIEPYITVFIGEPVVSFLIMMLSVRLLLQFVSAVLDGQHLVHVSSLLNPIEWTTRSVLQISLASIGLGLTGLLYGYLIAGLLAILVSFYFVPLHIACPKREHFNRLYSFGKYSWLSPFKNRSFLSMDTIILGLFVSNTFIGIYEIAWNIASIFAIFGQSIQRTLFPEISSLTNQSITDTKAKSLIELSLSYGGLYIIPGLVGGILVGDVVLSIYGSEFIQGYYVLLILIVARLFYLYQSQLLGAINATGHPQMAFRVNIVFLIINLVSNVILIYLYGWIGAAIATTVAALVGLLLSYYGLRTILPVRIPKREIGKQALAAMVMGVVVHFGRTTLGESLWIIVPLIFVGAVVYFMLLLGISNQFQSIVRDNIPQL